ncbi:MAG: tetratricopeptide repeat protein [Anaerolineae bacterium]|jgi:tetratricopeptide (TPR) repeat protein|nr:tetratricopeptide repeat protein [Anaerolineae bacterium]MBT4308778.1 tetratricopeptide repeat protein [Anaerolineae bacterium]MBT4460001.1 tetratricopeptide repeat protein [Anaerolineae bacterium]MBT6061950.1 tetratricopeptide repeat protein [Anaerolineae bacterium]MBT6324013.1 tetratricopeptide repeat protein [Anaerolineae bacterium]
MKRQSDIFFRKPSTNPYRLFILLILIMGGVWLIRQIEQGNITRPFTPTPTPTRVAQSYALEGDAQFEAGKLDAAITAYQEATRVDPTDAEVWSKLARIQIYSSAQLTTDDQQRDRLQEGLASINKAAELAPDDSAVHATRAFVLNWNANSIIFGEEQAADYLLEAEQEAVRALQLDNQNTLALAFYAEILVDEQKWGQAEQYILQAVEKDNTLMDVHRIYAYVLESLGQYNQAIQEYDKAIAISPNLTFLHLRAGANYRRLAFGSNNDATRTQLYESSLEYFAKAARLNEQLGIEDPIPYLSIAKTYSQEGEYFVAARNVQKALEIDPANPDIYGQLGIVYFKSRNYEGSIPAFKCAIRGCTAEESCDGRGGCGPNDEPSEVIGLDLSGNTVVYYYTYGSVLSALSRPQENYCEEAMTVMGEVRAVYSNDRDIMGIVQAGEAICQSLGE